MSSETMPRTIHPAYVVVENQELKHIKFDNGLIYIYVHHKTDPITVSANRTEFGFIDKFTGNVIVELADGLYDVTDQKFVKELNIEDPRYGFLTTTKSIVSRRMYLEYGASEDRLIFNCADHVACASNWSGSIEVKPHTLLTAIQKITTDRYDAVNAKCKWISEKFDYIYFMTEEGVKSAFLQPHVIIREAM